MTTKQVHFFVQNDEENGSSADEKASHEGSEDGKSESDSRLLMVGVESHTTLDLILHKPNEDDPEKCLEQDGLPGVSSEPVSTATRFKRIVRHVSEDAAVNLYFAKFLQAWGDRMWIFSIPILLLDLRRDPLPALFLPAVYGFCSGASTILFGPVMGEWVDHVPRLHAAKVVALCQNGFIGAAALVLAALIHFRDILGDWQLNACIAVLMVLSFSANIFYAATVIVLEKDWVAVIAGKQKSKLAGVISMIRRIELVTNVVCPLVMAQLMTYAGKDVTAMVIGLWSLVSMFTEYCAMKRTWKLCMADMEKVRCPTGSKRKKPLRRKIFRSCYSIYEGWSVFIRSKVCMAGLSTAFMEATVLIFSGVTNSYAVEQGFSNTAVALLAAGDALTGIIGTFVFPLVRKHTSLEKIGLVAMLFHFLCGSVCVTSNWLPGTPFNPMFFMSKTVSQELISHAILPPTTLPPFIPYTTRFYDANVVMNKGATVAVTDTGQSQDMTSLIVFAIGLTLGRFAFWIIDLTGSQLLLENIRDEERGTICAVHYSLKKLMNRTKYALAMFLSWPETFGFLIIASQLFSVIGYGFFFAHCRKNYFSKTRLFLKPKPAAPESLGKLIAK